jgi:hypothetical protein
MRLSPNINSANREPAHGGAARNEQATMREEASAAASGQSFHGPAGHVTS